MKKSCRTVMVALVLILWVSENAFAEFFSSETRENFPSWALAGERQVAQAVSETEDSSLAGSAAFSDFENRFAKNQYTFGLTLGYGFSFTLPPIGLPSIERTKLRFAYFFPNFKYNLTGLMGSSIYRGALYWVVEVGAAITVRNPTRNTQPIDDAPTFVIGLVPLQLEYKFLNPGRAWAPFLFAGVGGSWGDWYQEAREISTAFEFILQAGGGIEYFFANGISLNIHYRFWHLSNANVKSPNIGINAHIISLGFSF